MPATSRSSGPSTRVLASSLTSCFNFIGTSKVWPGLGRRQRVGNPGFGDRLGLVRGRFRRGFGGRLDVRANAEVRRRALGDCFEDGPGRFASVVTVRVRFIQKYRDADFRVVGRKETNERREIFVRPIGRLLAGAGFAR